MNKHQIFTLTITLLFACLFQPAFAEKTTVIRTQKIELGKTRTYAVSDTKIVMESILKVLKTEGYEVKYKNEELMYVSASKHAPIRDISVPLLAIYTLRTVWDTAQTVLTYGARSYTLVGDIMVIRIEFKDKDLETLIGLNINNYGDKTAVTANMSTLIIGKRDGLPVGKKNRLETIHLRDGVEYEIFFFKLNRELESQNIKCLESITNTSQVEHL